MKNFKKAETESVTLIDMKNSSVSEKLIELFLPKNIEKLTKEEFYKLFLIYEDIFKQSPTKTIAKSFEEEEDPLRKELILIKINDLLSTFKAKEYYKKEEIRGSHSIYWYPHQIKIYFKKIPSSLELMEIISSTPHQEIIFIEKINKKFIPQQIGAGEIYPYSEKAKIKIEKIFKEKLAEITLLDNFSIVLKITTSKKS